MKTQAQRLAGMETPTQQMREHLARQAKPKQTNTKCEQWPAWFNKQCDEIGTQTVTGRQPDATITNHHLCASHALELSQRNRGSR